MLEMRNVETCYGSSQVLFGVNLEIHSGEIVALIGRNGMGKTTTIRSITGFADITGGIIRFNGVEITRMPAYRIARLGIGLVPEGRQVFSKLTVKENLVATAKDGGKNESWNLDRIFRLFPELKEREHHMGCEISGGEQQMLSIGRALMTNPTLLLLDEATEGLAPLVRNRIWDCLDTIRASGISILVIDKNIDRLSSLCNRIYIVQKGQIVWEGSPTGLKEASFMVKECLGI